MISNFEIFFYCVGLLFDFLHGQDLYALLASPIFIFNKRVLFLQICGLNQPKLAGALYGHPIYQLFWTRLDRGLFACCDLLILPGYSGRFPVLLFNLLMYSMIWNFMSALSFFSPPSLRAFLSCAVGVPILRSCNSYKARAYEVMRWKRSRQGRTASRKASSVKYQSWLKLLQSFVKECETCVCSHLHSSCIYVQFCTSKPSFRALQMSDTAWSCRNKISVLLFLALAKFSISQSWWKGSSPEVLPQDIDSSGNSFATKMAASVEALGSIRPRPQRGLPDCIWVDQFQFRKLDVAHQQSDLVKGPNFLSA